MTINNEKEAPPPKAVSTWRSPTPEMKEKRNSMNDSAVEDDEREHRLERAERQMQEYAQNMENVRGKSTVRRFLNKKNQVFVK